MVVMALSLPAKKILVVDDDPVILKALSWDLEHAGYEVLTAVDGPMPLPLSAGKGRISSCWIFSFRPTFSRAATPGTHF